MEQNKNAVVVLTRGYNELIKYNDLINRNNSITNVDNTTTDFIIFHEGNITEIQQQYISEKSLYINKINFVDISILAFLNEKNNTVFYPPTNMFSLKYRHMCSFWFVDFWKYVEEYDYIIRIDEDCIINFSINNVFTILKNDKINCIFGKWVNDQEFVTHGLNCFTKNFITKNFNSNYNVKDLPIHNPSGPYTNVIGFNLKKLRENIILNRYINTINKSNAIYIYRWGDLPLWGEALYYFCDKNSYFEYNEIKYFHGSHNIVVN